MDPTDYFIVSNIKHKKHMRNTLRELSTILKNEKETQIWVIYNNTLVHWRHISMIEVIFDPDDITIHACSSIQLDYSTDEDVLGSLNKAIRTALPLFIAHGPYGPRSYCLLCMGHTDRAPFVYCAWAIRTALPLFIAHGPYGPRSLCLLRMGHTDRAPFVYCAWAIRTALPLFIAHGPYGRTALPLFIAHRPYGPRSLCLLRMGHTDGPRSLCLLRMGHTDRAPFVYCAWAIRTGLFFKLLHFLYSSLETLLVKAATRKSTMQN